jgi:sigma-B regulation protein RsbQ
MDSQDIIRRNNVTIVGSGTRTLLLGHGFGCDQTMWRLVLDDLAAQFRVVLFDYVGCGKSDISAFSRDKYSALDGYAADVIDICEALDLRDITFVGHSVSAMIGLLVAERIGDRIADMVMVCPSPCFLNHPPRYHGGFEREDIEELFNLMDKNYIGWAHALAPLVMGAANSSELSGELSGSFCSTDPVMARAFAQATFFSDCRALLPNARHRTLVLQSRVDALAAPVVGEFIAETMPMCTIDVIDAEGHCLHMTHPAVVSARIIRHVGAAAP